MVKGGLSTHMYLVAHDFNCANAALFPGQWPSHFLYLHLHRLPYMQPRGSLHEDQGCRQSHEVFDTAKPQRADCMIDVMQDTESPPGYTTSWSPLFCCSSNDYFWWSPYWCHVSALVCPHLFAQLIMLLSRVRNDIVVWSHKCCSVVKYHIPMLVLQF